MGYGLWATGYGLQAMGRSMGMGYRLWDMVYGLRAGLWAMGYEQGSGYGLVLVLRLAIVIWLGLWTVARAGHLMESVHALNPSHPHMDCGPGLPPY